MEALFIPSAIGVIVSSIVYGIEPVYNVVVKTKVLKVVNRRPLCRNGKIIKADPPKKPSTSHQKQNLTIEFADKSIRNYESSHKRGYDVDETILFNVLENNLLTCFQNEIDQLDYDNSSAKIGMNEPTPSETTVYYDKHDNRIDKGTEYTNSALYWLIGFAVLLFFSLIGVFLAWRRGAFKTK